MTNSYAHRLEVSARIAESQRMLEEMEDKSSIEHADAAVGMDQGGNVVVYLARDGGGYDKRNPIQVICAKQTVQGCPGYHGTVAFVRR